MRPRPSPGVRAVQFKNEHPEWADFAYEILFQKERREPYDIQYAVMQGLMHAYMMGLEGKYPPRPKGMDPRRREEPPPDPEVDEIFREMQFLAWSPLSGVPEPEGRMKWAIKRYFALKNPPPPSKARPVLARSKASEPVASTPVVVRRRAR